MCVESDNSRSLNSSLSNRQKSVVFYRRSKYVCFSPIFFYRCWCCCFLYSCVNFGSYILFRLFLFLHIIWRLSNELDFLVLSVHFNVLQMFLQTNKKSTHPWKNIAIIIIIGAWHWMATLLSHHLNWLRTQRQISCIFHSNVTCSIDTRCMCCLVFIPVPHFSYVINVHCSRFLFRWILIHCKYRIHTIYQQTHLLCYG